MGRLCLILDIDHTLLHCTDLQDYLPAARYSGQAQFHAISLHQKVHFIKLRPYLEQFLARVSELFECYICTHGDAHYAAEVQKIIDPTQATFGNRIITREMFKLGAGKSLHRIVPADKLHDAIVVDDSKEVWFMEAATHDIPLLHIRKFEYWSPLGINDGFTEDSALPTMLDILEAVHARRLQRGPRCTVMQILRELQGAVFDGCRFLFTGFMRKDVPLQETNEWRLATAHGAQVITSIAMATHVVYPDGKVTRRVLETLALLQRRQSQVVLVRSTWFYSSMTHLRRLPEAAFLHSLLQHPHRLAAAVLRLPPRVVEHAEADAGLMAEPLPGDRPVDVARMELCTAATPDPKEEPPSPSETHGTPSEGGGALAAAAKPEVQQVPATSAGGSPPPAEDGVGVAVPRAASLRADSPIEAEHDGTIPTMDAPEPAVCCDGSGAAPDEECHLEPLQTDLPAMPATLPSPTPSPPTTEPSPPTPPPTMEPLSPPETAVSSLDAVEAVQWAMAAVEDGDGVALEALLGELCRGPGLGPAAVAVHEEETGRWFASAAAGPGLCCFFEGDTAEAATLWASYGCALQAVAHHQRRIGAEWPVPRPVNRAAWRVAAQCCRPEELHVLLADLARSLLPVQPIASKLGDLLLSLWVHCVPEVLGIVWGHLGLGAMRDWLRRSPNDFVLRMSRGGEEEVSKPSRQRHRSAPDGPFIMLPAAPALAAAEGGPPSHPKRAAAGDAPAAPPGKAAKAGGRTGPR